MLREPVPQAYQQMLRQMGLAEIQTQKPTLLCFEKGEFLCHEGQPLEEIFYVIRGRVKVSVTASSGKTLLICFYEAEGVIGSIEVFTNRPATATAQAVTQTLCIGVSIQAHQAYFNTNAGFLSYFCTSMATMFARSSRNSALNILHPLQTRLCSYIFLTQEEGRFGEKLTETSELLGASYRHLLRTLEELCREGVLHKAHGYYKIADMQRLRALSDDYYGEGAGGEKVW